MREGTIRVMKKKRTAVFFLLVIVLTLSFSLVCSAGWKKQRGKYRYYVTASKTYVKSSWKQIGRKWYYFDAKGYLKTGKFQVDGQYYYAKKSTGRLSNRQYGVYYYGKDGAMVRSQWVKVGKKHFYYGSNGRMRTGRFTVNGKTYYCTKSSGRISKRRVGDYYYKSGTGEMVKNCWVGNYYYGSNGKSRYGKFTVDGKTYYCTKKSGKIKNKWYQKNYYDKTGVMARSQWIGKTYVDANGKIAKGDKNPQNPPSAADIRLLAAITYLEAGNQPYRGKVAVASVVINRKNSARFPNTLKGVIYQSGQFTPAMTGALTSLLNSGRKIQSECTRAAKEVLTEGSKLKGYYFFNTGGGRLKIGDHYFS